MPKRKEKHTKWITTILWVKIQGESIITFKNPSIRIAFSTNNETNKNHASEHTNEKKIKTMGNEYPGS